MKKYIDILEEIKTTGAAIKAAEEKEKALIAEYTRVENIVDRHNALKYAENKIVRLSEKRKDLEITRKILKSNARVALFHEVMPVALEVLSKYKGKPYGDKTRTKIAEEIKEKTGCRFYIGTSYSQNTYDIYPASGFGNDYNITAGTNYTNGTQAPLLIDNKIQIVPFEELHLYYISCEYVEDIPARVEELKQLYKKAVEIQEQLEAVCSQYNSLAVGDIKHIYHDKRLYKVMEV